MSIRRGGGALLFGVGAGVYSILAVCVATATTLAVPVFFVLWLTHSLPFSHGQTQVARSSLCSAWNSISTYGVDHGTPTTQEQLRSSLVYDETTLSAAKSIPSEMQGTVNSTVGTIREFITFLDTAGRSANPTTAQRQQATSLDSQYVQDGKTIDTWGRANC